MRLQVDVVEAGERFEELVQAAHDGHSFVIAIDGVPKCWLIPVSDGAGRSAGPDPTDETDAHD